MATVGLTEAEREAIERLENEVIHPSMTALVILDFWSDRSAGEQAALARARKGRRGICRQGRRPGQDRRRQGQGDRGAIPHPVDPDGLCDLPRPARRRPHRFPHRSAAEARARPAARPAQDRRRRGRGPGRDRAPLVAWPSRCWPTAIAPRAVSIFRQIRDMAPDDPAVIGGLVRALVGGGRDWTKRGEIVDALPPELAKKPEISRAGPRSSSPRRRAADTAALEARLAAESGRS